MRESGDKGYTSHMDLLSLMKNGSLATNRIKNENTLVEVSVHELDRGFIFRLGFRLWHYTGLMNEMIS